VYWLIYLAAAVCNNIMTSSRDITCSSPGPLYIVTIAISYNWQYPDGELYTAWVIGKVEIQSARAFTSSEPFSKSFSGYTFQGKIVYR